MSKQHDGTPGRKPPARALKLRLGRTPLEQDQAASRLNHRSVGQLSARRTIRLKLVGAPNRFRSVVAGARMWMMRRAARSAGPRFSLIRVAGRRNPDKVSYIPEL